MIFGDILNKTQKVQDHQKISANVGHKTFAEAVKDCKILIFTKVTSSK